MNLEPYLALLEQSRCRKEYGTEVKLTVEDLKKIDPGKLFHRAAGIRRSAIRELIESNYVGKLRILLELLAAEPDLDLKYEIRKGLNEIQSSEEMWEIEVPENIRNVMHALQSGIPEKIRKASQYIVKNRLTEVLPKALQMENDESLEQSIRSHLKKMNIMLMSFKGTVCSSRIAGYLEEEDPLIICRAISALTMVGSNRYIQKVLVYLDHNDPKVVDTTLSSLSLINTDRMEDILKDLADSKNERRRHLFLLAFERLNFRRLRHVLTRLLRDDVKEIRDTALALIQKLNDQPNAQNFEEHSPSQSTDSEVVSEEKSAPEDRVLQILKQLEIEKEPAILAKILRELKDQPGYEKKKLAVYMKALNHHDDSVRASAIEYMISFMPVGHLDFFIPFLEDSNHLVRGKAILAIAHDQKVFAANDLRIRRSILGLIDDTRTTYKLTAVDCLGIMQNLDYIDYCMRLASCGVASVESKMKSFLNSWSKVDGQVRQKVHDWLLKNNQFETEKIPACKEESTTNYIIRLKEVMDAQNDENKIKFLSNLSAESADFLIIEALLPYLKQESDPAVLSELALKLSELGCEDSYYHFQGFLKSSHPIMVFTGVKCLIQEHTFRIFPLVINLINFGDIDNHYHAEIIRVAMPYLVDDNKELALRGMQLLTKDPRFQTSFSGALQSWQTSNTFLTRESLNIICNSIDLEVVESCATYLFNHLSKPDFIQKMNQILTKISNSNVIDLIKVWRDKAQS